MSAKRRKQSSRDPSHAVSYARVSTEDQANRDLSLPAQTATIREYAGRKQLTLLQTYTEAGISGRNDDNRPELQRMLASVMLPSSTASIVLVYQTSRFMRNVERARALKKMLRQSGVRVVAVTQEVGTDAAGQFLETVLESMDEYESALIGARTSVAMRHAAKQGYRPGGRPPYGLNIKHVNMGGARRSLLEINPSEAECVREICKMVARGTGAVTVARELNKRGLYYRGESPWTKDLILNTTSDTAAIGKFVWGRHTDEPVEISTPPIVSEDLWRQVQVVRRERAQAHAPGRTNSSPMLLAGVVRCKRCGKAYQLESSGKPTPKGETGYRYYNCRSTKRSGRDVCPGGRVAEKLLDTAVLENLVEVIFSPERCRELAQALIAQRKSARSSTDSTKRRLRDELEDIERRVQRWELAFENGEIPADVGVDRVRVLKARKVEVEQTLRSASAPESDFGPLDDAAIDRFTVHVTSVFLGPDRVLAKRYLKLLVDRIETDGHEVSIHARESVLTALLEKSPPSTEDELFALATLLGSPGSPQVRSSCRHTGRTCRSWSRCKSPRDCRLSLPLLLASPSSNGCWAPARPRPRPTSRGASGSPGLGSPR